MTVNWGSTPAVRSHRLGPANTGGSLRQAGSGRGAAIHRQPVSLARAPGSTDLRIAP